MFSKILGHGKLYIFTVQAHFYFFNTAHAQYIYFYTVNSNKHERHISFVVGDGQINTRIIGTPGKNHKIWQREKITKSTTNYCFVVLFYCCFNMKKRPHKWNIVKKWQDMESIPVLIKSNGQWEKEHNYFKRMWQSYKKT